MTQQQRRQCPKDNDIYNRQRERTFSNSIDNSIDNEDRWHTATKDAFSVPKVEKTHDMGSRRDLLRYTLNKCITEKLDDDMKPKPMVDDGIPPSEYNDKFCDPKFTPFMDKLNPPLDTLRDFPLYASNNHSLYTEQVAKGTLKLRSEISNLNEPFRKNCTFTTSPDCALREPTGGF